jgi:hypothetical protein
MAAQFVAIWFDPTTKATVAVDLQPPSNTGTGAKYAPPEDTKPTMWELVGHQGINVYANIRLLGIWQYGQTPGEHDQWNPST